MAVDGPTILTLLSALKVCNMNTKLEEGNPSFCDWVVFVALVGFAITGGYYVFVGSERESNSFWRVDCDWNSDQVSPFLCSAVRYSGSGDDMVVTGDVHTFLPGLGGFDLLEDGRVSSPFAEIPSPARYDNGGGPRPDPYGVRSGFFGNEGDLLLGVKRGEGSSPSGQPQACDSSEADGLAIRSSSTGFKPWGDARSRSYCPSVWVSLDGTLSKSSGGYCCDTSIQGLLEQNQEPGRRHTLLQR